MKRNVGIIIGLLILFLCCLVYGNYQNSILKTRFALHALSRYLHAYELVEKKPIQSLSDLPDFHLVSYPHSLDLKSADLRSRVMNGYFYDFHRNGEKEFVVSASPLKVWPFSAEFGFTEDLNLRVNTSQVDSAPDSYQEVKQWTILPEWFELQTFQESS